MDPVILFGTVEDQTGFDHLVEALDDNEGQTEAVDMFRALPNGKVLV